MSDGPRFTDFSEGQASQSTQSTSVFGNYYVLGGIAFVIILVLVLVYYFYFSKSSSNAQKTSTPNPNDGQKAVTPNNDGQKAADSEPKIEPKAEPKPEPKSETPVKKVRFENNETPTKSEPKSVEKVEKPEIPEVPEKPTKQSDSHDSIKTEPNLEELEKFIDL